MQHSKKKSTIISYWNYITLRVFPLYNIHIDKLTWDELTLDACHDVLTIDMVHTGEHKRVHLCPGEEGKHKKALDMVVRGFFVKFTAKFQHFHVTYAHITRKVVEVSEMPYNVQFSHESSFITTYRVDTTNGRNVSLKLHNFTNSISAPGCIEGGKSNISFKVV